jgi:hypothetical protein
MTPVIDAPLLNIPTWRCSGTYEPILCPRSFISFYSLRSSHHFYTHSSAASKVPVLYLQSFSFSFPVFVYSVISVRIFRLRLRCPSSVYDATFSSTVFVHPVISVRIFRLRPR